MRGETVTTRHSPAKPPSVIYREPAFLDRAACARIVAAMDDGVIEQAEVLDGGFEWDRAIRHATSIDVAPVVLEELERALDSRRSRLANFFGIALAEREGAGFLRYPAGGFYAPHVDRAYVDAWPAAARRAIAVVVFLNGAREGKADGAFNGGTLRIFADGNTMDVVPRAGLLVAFRADVLHEVTEVQDGIRDAVVDWFYRAEST